MNAIVPSVPSVPQPGSASLRPALHALNRNALRRIPSLCDEGVSWNALFCAYGNVKRIEPKTM